MANLLPAHSGFLTQGWNDLPHKKHSIRYFDWPLTSHLEIPSHPSRGGMAPFNRFVEDLKLINISKQSTVESESPNTQQ